MLVDNIQLNADTEQVLNDLRDCLIAKGSELFSNGFKKSGDNIMMQCPYHSDGQERKPSAGIRISDGVFHCFACGKTCSFQEFISNCFGYDDGGLFGIKWLLKNYVSVSVKERKDVDLDFQRYSGNSNRSVFNRVCSGNDSLCTNSWVGESELEKYRYIHPYMYERGLTDDVIELFDIGYDQHDRCITFPIRDIQGHCLFVARRSVDYKFFHYPLGVAKPVYGLYELKLRAETTYRSPSLFGKEVRFGYPNEVIVCESMLDALSFWTVGKYAVALNGLGNELQFQQLRDLPCRKIILCTDMDKAGMKARQVLKRELSNKIVTEYTLPEGRKDANECTKEELLALNDYF